MKPEDITERLAECARVCEGVPTERLRELPDGALVPFAMGRAGLTGKQAHAFEIIKAYEAENGQAITVMELQEALGTRSRSEVMAALRGLERRGYIRRRPRAQRSITIIKPEELTHETTED